MYRIFGTYPSETLLHLPFTRIPGSDRRRMHLLAKQKNGGHDGPPFSPLTGTFAHSKPAFCSVTMVPFLLRAFIANAGDVDMENFSEDRLHRNPLTQHPASC